VSFTDNTTKYFLMSQYKFLMEDSTDYLEILQNAEDYLDNRFCNMSILEKEFNNLDKKSSISSTHLASSIIGNPFIKFLTKQRVFMKRISSTKS
jgi:hypothetical protein